MYSVKQYKADLNRIGQKYREQVKRWLEDGILPDDKVLIALLTGEYTYVIRELDQDLSEILDVLDRYCDFCHGSPLLVAQYEFFKQMGRQASDTKFRLGTVA